MRCWSYGAMWMQMPLLAVVQPHRELHSPFLNAAAETSEGVFVEDFPGPSRLSPLGKVSSWAPKIAPARAAPVTQPVSGSEHISTPWASSSCQSLLQAIFFPPPMWLGNTRNKTRICSFLFLTRKKVAVPRSGTIAKTKSKSLPMRLPCRSHHRGHNNQDTKFDATGTTVNL